MSKFMMISVAVVLVHLLMRSTAQMCSVPVSKIVPPLPCDPKCGKGSYFGRGACLSSGRCLCWWGWTGSHACYVSGGAYNNRIIADSCVKACPHTSYHRNYNCITTAPTRRPSTQPQSTGHPTTRIPSTASINCDSRCGGSLGTCQNDGHCFCSWGWTGPNATYITSGANKNRILADYCTTACHYTRDYLNASCASIATPQVCSVPVNQTSPPLPCDPKCGKGIYYGRGSCLSNGRCLCWWGWTGPNACCIEGGNYDKRIIADSCFKSCHYTHDYQNNNCTTAAPTSVPSTQPPSTGHPTTGQPKTSKPTTTKQPISTTGIPITGQPTTGQRVTSRPTTPKRSTAGIPTSGQPTTGQPITSSLTTGQPSTGMSTVRKPSTGKVTTRKWPTTPQKPTAQRTTTSHQPSTKHQTTRKTSARTTSASTTKPVTTNANTTTTSMHSSTSQKTTTDATTAKVTTVSSAPPTTNQKTTTGGVVSTAAIATTKQVVTTEEHDPTEPTEPGGILIRGMALQPNKLQNDVDVGALRDEDQKTDKKEKTSFSPTGLVIILVVLLLCMVALVVGVWWTFGDGKHFPSLLRGYEPVGDHDTCNMPMRELSESAPPP